MAKKYEFKPDKPRSTLLSKLHLTRLQRRTLLKWALYALILLVLSIMQDVLLCRVQIFGATTELVPCGIFLICLAEGAESGSVFALISSSLYLFSGTAAGNYSIVFITACAVGATLLRQSYLQKTFSAAMLCTACAMTVYTLCVFAIGLFLGLTTASRIGSFLMGVLLTMITAPAIYPVVSAVSRIGGDAWKE